MELRVLIVDDEEIICDGICNKIKRLIPHAIVVGKAQDANEAMDLIKENKPNIIITDICMPEINGIEFLKGVREIDKNIKFVIISGYQDFDYAKSAISLGVVEYLLKPIENEQLKSVMSKIEKKIIEEEENKTTISSLETKVRKSIELLKNKYLSDVINHADEFDINQIVKSLEALDIRFTKKYFTIITAAITCSDDSTEFILEKDLPLIRFSIKNISEEILEPIGDIIAFEDLKDNRQAVILINHNNIWDSSDEIRLLSMCRKIIFSINKYFKVSISMGIGKTCDSVSGIPNSYMESYIAVLQRIITGDNSVINFAQVKDSNRITFFLTEEQKMRLISCIKDGNCNQSGRIINKIFEQIEKENVPYNNIRVLFIDLFLLISKTVKECGGSIEKILKENIFSDKYLLKCTSLTSLKNLINAHIDLICSYINDLKKSQGKKVIDEIKEYIDKYYYSEVSLTDLANRYYLNPNYLSQLFKTEIGENFVDYITKKRIEKSVELLSNTEFQAYKIGQMVGYLNPRYFSDVFRKITGVTPSQFRQQNDQAQLS